MQTSDKTSNVHGLARRPLPAPALGVGSRKMALKGDTSNLLLADIFQTLAQNGQSGVLQLRAGNTVHKLLFAAPGITLLEAQCFRAPRLGHLLAASGMVPAAEIDAMLQEVDRDGPNTLSAIALICLLEEKGRLSVQQGADILRGEVREELFEVFTLERMEFEFQEDSTPVEGIPPQCFFRTEEVVLEAARRLDEWTLIRKNLDPEEFLVAHPDAAPAPEHARIAELLDGRHTVIDVSEALLTSRFDVSRIVWRMLEAEQVRAASPDELLAGARELDPKAHRSRLVKILQRARAKLKPEDGRFQDVAELFIRAGSPTAAVAALIQRARVLLRQGDQETAYTVVLRARELDPADLGVLQMLVELHAARGEKNEQIQVLTQLAERSAAAERYDEAVSYGGQLARLFPDSPLLDRAFSHYCQKSELRKRGADVLLQAATQRKSPGKAAVLYEAVLLLDPNRSDAKKAVARYRRARSRSRYVWIALGIGAIPALGILVHNVVTRLEKERLRGRVDAVSALLEKDEAALASAELARLRDVVQDRELRAEVDRLIQLAQERVVEQSKADQSEREKSARSELDRVQKSIDARRFSEAVRCLDQLTGRIEGAELKDAITARIQILLDELEKEQQVLVRLAAAFEIPKFDADLLRVRNTYARPFTPERLAEFRDLEAAIKRTAKDGILGKELPRLSSLAKTGLEALERVRPGIAEVQARVARNVELEQLSDDYQKIQEDEANGDFAAVVKGLDRLLENYGDGTLAPQFRERRAAAAAISEAVAEAEELALAGEGDAAQQHMKACAAAITNYDVGLLVGLPVRVTSIPSGARIRVNGVAAGAAPRCVWLKAGLPTLIGADAPGFDPLEIDLPPDSSPNVDLELQRAARFRVEVGSAVDSGLLLLGDSVVLGGRDGAIRRLSLADGKELAGWQSGSLVGAATAPAYAAGRVVVCLGEGEFAGLDPVTLAPAFQKDLGSPAVGPLAVDGSHVIAALADGRIIALDAATGAARTIAALGEPLRSGPALTAGIAAIGTTSGRVIGIALSDGHAEFRTPPASLPIVGIAATAHGFVAADDGGTLVSLSPQGHELWRLSMGDSTAAAPTSDGPRIAFAAGNQVFALDAATGETIASFSAGEWLAGPPLLHDGMIFAGDRGGALHVFDLERGELAYRHRFAGALQAMPLPIIGGVVVAAASGEVERLDS